MIRQENLQINGQEFIRTYSDDNRYVVRDGVSYSEAVDPAEFNRVYTEGEEMPNEGTTDEDYVEIGKILMGVSE